MFHQLPAGMTPDRAADFGIQFFACTVQRIRIVDAATSSTNITLTAAQFYYGLLHLTSGASGAFTITLPSTAALLAALPAQVATDGTFSFPVSIMNDNIGQTGTLTHGDSSTTMTGTMTIATNTRRDFLVKVTGVGTITVYNVGSAAL